MSEAGYGAYDEISPEPVGLICMGGQKGSGGESKNDSLPLLAFAFCFFRLYALPFGMVLVAGFRMPQVSAVRNGMLFVLSYSVC